MKLRDIEFRDRSDYYVGMQFECSEEDADILTNIPLGPGTASSLMYQNNSESLGSLVWDDSLPDQTRRKLRAFHSHCVTSSCLVLFVTPSISRVVEKGWKFISTVDSDSFFDSDDVSISHEKDFNLRHEKFHGVK